MKRCPTLRLFACSAATASAVLTFMLVGCETGTTGNGSINQSPGGGTDGVSSVDVSKDTGSPGPAPAAGEAGGACYPNGTCNGGLSCDPSGSTCIAPQAQGEEGAPCYPNGTCNDSLECDSSGVCQVLSSPSDGPTQDAVFPTGDAPYEPYPGGSDDCPQTTVSMDVPWLSQAIAGNNIASNLCCGPAVVTMIKGYVDGQSSIGDSDLKATIDWMDTKLSVSANSYNCVGTEDDDVVDALKGYVGVEAEAINTPWCNLLSKLDGNHIVIFHGDSQGGNNTGVFKAGSSHWLILEQVDSEFAYVNDPGRSFASQGDSKKFSVKSVRERYKTRGELAIIAKVGEPACPNPPTGSVTTPIDGAKVCDDFQVAGQVQDLDGVDRVTVTIGSDQNCKFSREVSGDPSSYSYDITVVPDGACSLGEGSHNMAVWVLDSCGGAKVAAQSSFYYQCGDLCTGKTCPSCQQCSLATGNCVPDFGANGDSCGGEKQCVDGFCQTKPPGCGDGECNGTETPCSCSQDCSGCCSASDCPSCGTCKQATCSGSSCSCSNQSNGTTCSGGTCQSGSCQPKPPTCGDGECNGTETPCSCSQDCSGCCSASDCPSCGTCKQAACSGSSCSCSNQSNGTSCSGGTCQSGSCVPTATASYSISPKCSSWSTSASYSCGGGVVFSICGTVSTSGKVTVKAHKSGGSTFGSGEYVVRVFDPNVSSGDKCKQWNTIKASSPTGIGTDTLAFSAFDSLANPGDTKGYCVTKTDGGDGAWWCSGELTLNYD